MVLLVSAAIQEYDLPLCLRHCIQVHACWRSHFAMTFEVDGRQHCVPIKATGVASKKKKGPFAPFCKVLQIILLCFPFLLGKYFDIREPIMIRE